MNTALTAARWHNFRIGSAISIILFCLLSLPSAYAQSASATPSLHSLQQQVTQLTQRVDATGSLVYAVLLTFMAMACLTLWWNARIFTAFRSLGLYLLAVASAFLALYINASLRWQTIPIILTSLLLPEMCADVLGIRKGAWIWLNRIAVAIALLLAWSPWLLLVGRITTDISELLVLALLPIALIRGDARKRLIAAALTFVWFFRAPLDPAVRRIIPLGLHIGGWRWNVAPIGLVIFSSIAIAIFVRQLMEDQREKERLAGELEAGRAMQQMMLGVQPPAIPGLRMESAYQPAGEVGGDFFQLLPAPGGGLLVIVGDVSGKGLRAAMTVATILGVLQALPPAPPAQLLRALNQALAGRLHGGLATCCVLRIDPGGNALAANAGHLSPYLNGQELAIESGLPLGIVEDIEYAESSFRLAPSDQLTILSDGVLEARNSSGELYGFDRTRVISTQSAEAIAKIAQSFGQEDDITVLTLTLTPA